MGTGRQRTLSTSTADTARRHDCSLRPLQQCHKARQKFGTTSPCSYHSLHETIPSGKDTCSPARSSDLIIVRSNNSCPDWRPRQCYSTYKAGQFFCTTMPLPQPARYHSFGKGHVHARSVLEPEHGTEQQRLPQQETEDLQKKWDSSKQAQKLAKLDIRRYLHSHTDSDMHSMQSASPAVRHSLKRRESLQNAPKGKNVLDAGASWSARYHLFGEGHGQTCTVLGPVQPSKQKRQISATQELQWQNFTESARRHHTPKYGLSEKIWNPADQPTQPHSTPDFTQRGAAFPNKNLKTIRQPTPFRTHKG